MMSIHIAPDVHLLSSASALDRGLDRSITRDSDGNLLTNAASRGVVNLELFAACDSKAQTLLLGISSIIQQHSLIGRFSTHIAYRYNIIACGTRMGPVS